MASYTLATLNTAIETTLATATGITRSQDLSEISESIPVADMPLLMVYPQTWTPQETDTAKNTFGGSGTAIHYKVFTFRVDIYIAHISKVAQAITSSVTVAQAINDVLDAQQNKPLFGDSAIQNFRWSANRLALEYSNQIYAGLRYELELDVF